VWGGLRVYLGQKDKTLIRRHREDPVETLPSYRRAVLLRFARAAADRLHRLADPGGGPDFW